MTGVDFISSLPDEILHHILSFSPTKLAIRTSVLSKRWSHVWSKTPRIHVDCNKADPASINKTLSNYSFDKIKTFTLITTPDVSAAQIDSWIEFGTSRNAEELYLNLSNSNNYTFSDSFFINSSVQHLTLILFRSEIVPERNVAWTSLKRLSLNWFKLPDESITAILTGSPMLETLILNFCTKLPVLDLSEFVNLKRLEIQSMSRAVRIVAPHVRYLRMVNCHMDTSLVNVSSLTEAKFDLASYTGDYILESDCLPDRILKMLTKLQNVEKLTLGAVVLQILSLVEIHRVAFPELKTKDLTVETMVTRSVIPGITRLLQNVPALKKITVHTRKRGKLLSEQEIDKYLIRQSLNPGWGGNFPTVEETCEFIRGVAFATNTKFKHVVGFMEIVLHNAKTVEAMVLRLEGYLDAEEYQKLLPKLPTVSRNENERKCCQMKAILKSFKIIP